VWRARSESNPYYICQFPNLIDYHLQTLRYQQLLDAYSAVFVESTSWVGRSGRVTSFFRRDMDNISALFSVSPVPISRYIYCTKRIRAKAWGLSLATPTASHLLPPSTRFLRYNKGCTCYNKRCTFYTRSRNATNPWIWWECGPGNGSQGSSSVWLVRD
jgi:hypothetical protein